MPIEDSRRTKKSIAEIVGLPVWAVKMAFRIAQVVNNDGVYPFALHVADGEISLFVTGGKREKLHKKTPR